MTTSTVRQNEDKEKRNSDDSYDDGGSGNL